jgi:hypothetical protein
MTRTIVAILAGAVLSHAQPSPASVTAPATVTGTYHFTTPLTQQGLQEAATIVQSVALAAQVSVDSSTATFTFSGPADAVNFAEWVLPRIDKAAGDNTPHEYRLPSGDTGRVKFVPNVQSAHDIQELLTILRTVADVQRVYTFTSNHAIVLRGPHWEIAFADWIIDQINQPVQQRPDPTPREFTVGGPDFRGMGHGARLNFLTGMTSQRQTQELLTVLRTVGDIVKVFSYATGHALVLRAGDTDLQRAEWIIAQLDLPAGQASGAATFTASAGDDVTRTFHLRDATADWLQTAVTAMRTELKIKKVFPTTAPPNIVVRGTTDQIAAAMTWMTSHNALLE